MVSRSKKLRSGYTTGACAAAAAKAATMLLIRAEEWKRKSAEAKKYFRDKSPELPDFCTDEVEIPFPDGSRVKFKIYDSSLITHHPLLISRASVIKDAGDDPDVTNGAEIVAEVTVRSAECGARKGENNDSGISSLLFTQDSLITIKGGKGVGVVTKPGLPMPVGEAAINPVPRKMIAEAVTEAIHQTEPSAFSLQPSAFSLQLSAFSLQPSALEVTISVPEGERLAKKTLNSRLGIIGGISILGTTGIVRPLSTEAWTASITAAMDVARAMGHDEVVLSSGRASEEAHMKRYNLPVESYVMMGDYLEFSLLDAKKHEFNKIHLCAQWAKMLKIAMTTPQTHVRHGAIDMKKTVAFLNQHGVEVPGDIEFNTAREIFEFINATFSVSHSAFSKVCNAAKKYTGGIAGDIPVITYLVSYQGEIISNSD